MLILYHGDHSPNVLRKITKRSKNFQEINDTAKRGFCKEELHMLWENSYLFISVNYFPCLNAVDIVFVKVASVSCQNVSHLPLLMATTSNIHLQIYEILNILQSNIQFFTLAISNTCVIILLGTLFGVQT